MKKVIALAFAMAVLLCSGTSFAQQKYVLGEGNLAFKVDWINFTDDVFDSVDLDDGIYLGLEGYVGLTPNLYIGAEIGWATTKNDGRVTLPSGRTQEVDVDVFYVPIELNLKYAAEVAPNWVVGFGGGISYNWFDLDIKAGDRDADVDADWVFGLQVFGEINYKFNEAWFAGVNGKYQWTEDLTLNVRGEDRNFDTSAGNFRLGLQVGYMF